MRPDSPLFLRAVNEVHFSNMNKLEQIANLDAGWNGYGAEPISHEVIDNVKRTIDYLENKKVFAKWEIFPTARDSVQLELDFKGNYIEIEVFNDHLSLFIDGRNSIDVNEVSLERLVKELRNIVEEVLVSDYEKLKWDIQSIRYKYIVMNDSKKMNNSKKMTAILNALMLAEDLCDYNLCLDDDLEWAEMVIDILKIDPLTFP